MIHQPSALEMIDKPVPPVGAPVIFVMPEKFHGGGKGKEIKPKKTGKLALLIGGTVLAVFVIAAAAVYISLGLERKSTSVQNAPVVSLENRNVASEPENALLNTGVSEEEQAIAPVPEEQPLEETSENALTAEKFPSGLDTDGDGLSDREESLYNTGTSRPDTDGDGYPDGLEVRHLYNPAGVAPVRLLDSGLVSLYKNAVLGYEIFYPRVWTARVLDQTEQEVLFTADTGEFVQVIAEENPEGLTAAEWYAGQVPGTDLASLEKIDTDVFQGIKNGNGLIAYVNVKNDPRDVLYILAYNVGTRIEASFPATFDMMIRSFALQAP